MDALFDTSQQWTNFGSTHLVCALVSVSITVLVIWFANNYLNKNQQKIFGTLYSCLPALAVFVRMCSVSSKDELITAELPLYICRLLALTIPYMMWTKNRDLFGIMYFWTLAGTFNALVTPDMDYGFPHYSAWCYWILHAGLVSSIFYALFVYKLRPNLRDIWRSFLAANVYFVIIHLINMVIDANYSYTMQKPPGGSLLDYMGPWPIYILSTELLAVVLFFILYLPFAFCKNQKSQTTPLS